MNVPADPPSPLDARNVGRRVITFDNGRTEDVYAVEVNHESGRWEQIWVKRSSEMADRVADALNASSPAPAGLDERIAEYVAVAIAGLKDGGGVTWNEAKAIGWRIARAATRPAEDAGA